MGSFEKDLFKRMDELELEESRYLAKEAVTDDDDEEKEQDSDEAALTDDDFNHPGNRSDVDVPSEDDEQSDDEKEEEDLTSQKPVRRVSFAKDSKSGDGSFPSEAGARGIPPPSSSQWIPVRNLVVETEDPEEIFENESDVEEYQLGREIALEYAWRRNRLEVTNSIPRKGTGLPSEVNMPWFCLSKNGRLMFNTLGNRAMSSRNTTTWTRRIMKRDRV